MALNWGRSLCQPSYQIQVSPSTVHDERVLGFYTSASAAATHPQYYNPDPYARVSPASFTRDFDQSPSSYYHGDSPPNFSRPLSMSVLNDPAFSSDPRLHPHFPLVSPTFFKELPSKSPVMLVRNLPHTPPYTHSHLSPHQEFIYPIDRSDFSHSSDSEEEHPSPTISTSVSLDSDSHTAFSAFSSPTVSSATSHSHSQFYPKAPRVPSPVPPFHLSLPFSKSPVPTSPNHDPGPSPAMHSPTSVRPIPKRHVSAPEQREKVVKPPTVRFNTAPVHADGSNRPTGKRNMKNFMRRFTTSRSLDRIDELDETDPFGAGWHHGGPYEAIGSNLAQLGPAHKYNDIDILRGDLYSKSKRENVPRPVRTQKSPRVPQVGVGGQSLNIVPGQIFHQSPIGDTISSPQANTVNPNADLRNPGSGQVEPSHSRSHSTPLYHPIKPPEGPPSDTSLHVPASRFPPRIHHFGVDIPHLPQHPRPAHDELASYPLYQIHSAPVLAPDPNKRYPETMSPSRGDANFRTLVSSPPIVEPPNGQGNHLAPDLPRHRSTHSLDSSRTRTTTATQSTSRTQNSLQPPRTNRHLPKRLVMPTPLQPQQPLPQQQQLDLYPQADYYDPYADPDLFPPTKGHAHEPAAMYHQGRKLLRKKTAVFPGNVPLPTHAPVVNVDAIPPLTKHPSLSIAEAGKVKERVHRRRLSKRKHDV